MAPPWLGEKPGGCVRFGVRALFHPARCVLVGFTAGGKLFPSHPGRPAKHMRWEERVLVPSCTLRSYFTHRAVQVRTVAGGDE